MQFSIKIIGDKIYKSLISNKTECIHTHEWREDDFIIRCIYIPLSTSQINIHIHMTPNTHLPNHNELFFSNRALIHFKELINSKELLYTKFLSKLGIIQEDPSDFLKIPFKIEASFGPISTLFSNNQINKLSILYHCRMDFKNLDFENELTISEKKSRALFLSLEGNFTINELLTRMYLVANKLHCNNHTFIKNGKIVSSYEESGLINNANQKKELQNHRRFKHILNKLHTKKDEAALHNFDSAIELHNLRHDTIVNIVNNLQKKNKIVDFGSGTGKLSSKLGLLNGIEEILSIEPYEKARLSAINQFNKFQNQMKFTYPTTLWGSLYYYDERLKDTDVLILCEVIEHIEEHRLTRAISNVFELYTPDTIIISTPNRDYNKLFNLIGFRHNDHRFEWTRQEFYEWCKNLSDIHNYNFSIQGIGHEHMKYGSPTQLVIFKRKDGTI